MRHMIRKSVGLAAMLLLLGGTAAPASADWLLTPYIGVTFGGSADIGDVFDLDDDFERKAAYGISAAWMGGGVFGFEIDFATSPNFLDLSTGPIDWGNSNVTTLMGNLVLGVPIGGQRGFGVRPYATAGFGLLRTRVEIGDLFDDLSSNELGVNVGGGAHVFFSDLIGLRGDLRYFRGLTEDDEGLFDLGFENFEFWRGTVGITFRF